MDVFDGSQFPSPDEEGNWPEDWTFVKRQEAASS